MRRYLVALCLVAASLPVMAGPARAQHDNLPDCASKRETGYITVAEGTPDETELHYQVFIPKSDPDGDGKFHAVMDYSGYQPGLHIWDGLHRHFTCEGYAVIGLNIRGTACSGGEFDYFEPRQAEDGREAIEELATMEWSSGRIAMVGKSYPGITQLFVAGQPGPDGSFESPKGLVAIVPGHVFGDLYRDVPYPGGIMNVTFASYWSAGRIVEPFQAPIEDQLRRGTFDEQCSRNMLDHVQNPPQNPFVKALHNQYDGPLFKERSPWYWAENIDVPTFLIESWQDEQVGSRATELVERFDRTDADGDPPLTWRALFTNGDHGEYYGSHVLPAIDEFLRFHLAQEIPARFQGGTVTTTTFDPKHQNPTAAAAAKDEEKGKGTYTTTSRPETYDEALARYEAELPVQINWETGANGDRVPAWTTRHDDFPASETRAWRLNLTAEGHLTEAEAGPGSKSFDYVPGQSQQRGYPLTQGQQIGRWTEKPEPGTYAMFESPVFGSDKVLAGPASVDLTVSSTAVDTDFQVTLTELRPDGKEMFIQQGWLRASHRKLDEAQSTALRPFQTHELLDSQPLVPGQPTQIRIEVFPFAHALRAGSKLRVYVEAPHVKPDLWGFAILPVPARNTIHTGPGLSSIALPLLEGATAQAPPPPCTVRNQPCR